MARLSVAGNTGQAVHIGNIFSRNYAGINLNETIADGNYNFIGSSADPNLYIIRGTGYTINFRENNLNQMTINAAPTVGTSAADALTPRVRLSSYLTVLQIHHIV